MNFFLRRRRPRLSVCIHTRNSADRIEKLIAEAFEFADEVVVGVDASSHDDTFDRVSRLADIAWHFHLPQQGQNAPMRLAATDYATGDWILQLDDDESMEPTFDALRDELMSDPAVTHHYLARKYIVSMSPPSYIRAGPWYPDWQLRLFRNDRSLVWSPLAPHKAYQVQGPGHFEMRTSILHFEPLWCSPEKRVLKHREYREAGSTGEIEKSLTIREGLPQERVALRPAPLRHSPRKGRKVFREIRTLERTPLPGWQAQFLSVKLAPTVQAGTLAIANVRVRNTGRHAWSLHTGRWPHLNLAFRLLNERKELLQQDGFRFPLPRQVKPGQEALFAAPFTAPGPGNYFLEWDLVSELECWFRDCGSPVHLTPLKVI